MKKKRKRRNDQTERQEEESEEEEKDRKEGKKRKKRNSIVLEGRAREKVDDLMSCSDLSLSHSAQGASKIAFRLINRLRTMVPKDQESICKYRAIHSSICSFACSAHSFPCSALLALLTRFTALIHLLACSLTF